MKQRTAASPETAPPVAWSQAFATWCRVAALSFGGPAGQIAVMHRILVDEKRWVGEERFLHALNYCMLLPGPEAQQLAVYIGWLMHGTWGGLMAGTLFVLPGFVSMLILSFAYAYFQDTELLQALFFGLKPAVMAIVFEAVLRISRRILNRRLLIWLSVASFIAIFLLHIPFPLLIACAGLLGIFMEQYAPALLGPRPKSGDLADGHDRSISSGSPIADHHAIQPSLIRSLKIIVVGGVLWFGPLVVASLWLGSDSILVQEGLFFSKAAVVTFGGAYSVLAYIGQQAVEKYRWLDPGEMLDGLGLAESTPGPLIMVVQFVGFLGAFRRPGPFDPWVAGVAGAVMTTWVTFVPCFVWIFLGAPYVEWCRQNRWFRAALATITATVLGVVAHLAVWFAMHTLFAEIHTQHWGPLHLSVPQWSTLHLRSLSIGMLACLLTFYWKRGMVVTLGASVALGMLLYLTDR